MGEFGITRLADVTGLDVIGLPVYMAVRPNSRSLSVSQGKGLDRESAMASALMESIESWHAERISAPLRHESYTALRRTECVIDVTRLPRTRSGAPSLNAPMLWIEGHDLLQERPAWVPYETVTTNFVAAGRMPQIFGASSNGLASGNQLAEAVTHALYEVVERDACALWRADGGPAAKDRQVDLTSVRDPHVARVLDLVRAADLEVAVWDATSDVGVPTFACQVFDKPDRARWALKGVFGGQGAHLDPEIALLRAVTEAIQSRLTYIAGSRDDMFAYETLANPDDLRAMSRSVNEPPGSRPMPVAPHVGSDTFEEDIELVLHALRGVGIESVVVVGLTRPDVEIPVVKVVVPGLESDVHGNDQLPGARARAL